jgi:dihydrofolate reductase/thymidylate synthase
VARDFDIVVAADEAGGIGRSGALPWRLPGDTAFFKRLTTETSDAARANAVVMGRKTWETIPPRLRPLARRINVIVSRSPIARPAGVLGAASLEAALALLAEPPHAGGLERTFVIGGGEIYRIALAHPGCRRVYLTRVEGRFDCDTFFPELGEDWRMVSASERHEEGGVGYVFLVYERRR